MFFHADGSTEEESLYKGESLTEIPTPTAKVGYTAYGKWYVDEEYSAEASFENLQTSVSVYAKATPNEYTLTYNANGGSVEEPTQTVTYDASYTLFTPTHTNAYMEFIGWEDENGYTIAQTGVWDTDSGKTLTAQWKDNTPIYTVTFIEGSKSTEIKVKEGADIPEAEIPVLTQKTGYTVDWDSEEFTNIQSDMTITAIATPNTYTATYDADGFEIDGTTVSLTYDAVCTNLDMSLTKEGQNFVGWLYNGKTYTQESIWQVAEDVELTPVWQEKE